MMSIQESNYVCDSFVIIHVVSLSSPAPGDHPLLAAIFDYFAAREKVNLCEQPGQARARALRSLRHRRDNPRR
jgi:hypothetical protein